LYFQFTKQAVIETYTLFLNNFKTAKEAIKTTCQAKPAFARFLEVNKKTALVIITCFNLFEIYNTVHFIICSYEELKYAFD
jgi:hypothetical protein